MDGEQLPKATLVAFIKKHTNTSFSADYISKCLFLAKQFIERLADKSNNICEGNQKKTINVEHLETALKEFKVTKNLSSLKEIEGTIKVQNQLKRQATQRLEEMLAKNLQQEKERLKSQPVKPRQQVPRQKFSQIQKNDKKQEDDFDYQNYKQAEVQADNK